MSCNYKSLIKSRNVRIWILSLLRFVPDKVMLSLQYRIKLGRKINWKNPQRFSEKLQLYKIWQKKHPELNNCADKFDVRSHVRKTGLEDILNPLVGQERAYNSPDEIEWELLPEQFVLKDTLGGGGNSVIICTDKSKFDIKAAKDKCKKWVMDKRINAGREHVYDGRPHRIIIENFLQTDTPELGLIDYKFFCFNGVPKYLYVISNRKLGVGAELGIYDMDYNLLPYRRNDELPPVHQVPKPQNFDEMKKIAERLSASFPQVRIDLYSVSNKIYFGEMTFFDGSGYMSFEPDEFDFIMGKEFELKEI